MESTPTQELNAKAAYILSSVTMEDEIIMMVLQDAHIMLYMLWSTKDNVK